MCLFLWLLCQSGDSKRVCHSYNSLSFLPSSLLMPCLPWFNSVHSEGQWDNLLFNFSAKPVNSRSCLLHASTLVQIIDICHLNYSTLLTSLPAFDFGHLHSILFKAVLVIVFNSLFIWYLFPPLEEISLLLSAHSVETVVGIVDTQYIEWRREVIEVIPFLGKPEQRGNN